MNKQNTFRSQVVACKTQALAVGYTHACGSVRMCAKDLAALPLGGWPETRQARMLLVDAVDHAARGFSLGVVRAAASSIVDDIKDAHFSERNTR